MDKVMKDYKNIAERMRKAGIWFNVCRNEDHETSGSSCVTSLEDAIDEMDAWDAAHPVKTYAQDFFEKHPNASGTYYEGVLVPDVCCHTINGVGCPKFSGDWDGLTCFRYHPREHAECWNRPMKEDAE